MTEQASTAVDLDVRARKRAAIGLAPTRPTAKAAPQRPPRASGGPGVGDWPLVGLVLALLVATGLLLAAQLTGSPTTWLQVRASLPAALSGSWARRRSPAVPSTISPLAEARTVALDEFDDAAGLLPPNQQDGEWSFAVLPADSLYEMVIEQPSGLAWSTIGGNPLHNFVLEGSFRIADLTPAAVTGFIARYQDRGNFYLLAIDGYGRWQVQRWQAGVTQIVVPWTESGQLNLAGYANTLTLADTDAALRFWANGAPLFEATVTDLPPGDAGIFGQAPPTMLGEITLDWLRLAQAE